MRYFLIAGFSLMMLSGKAQVEKQTYIDKLKTICPGADIVELETKEDYVEIEYLCGKKLFETGLTFDSKIIYTETETTIDEKTLFQIQEKLNKRYFGWAIDEFTLVEMPDTGFYKAEIIRDGIEENVYFTFDGKYYKPENQVLNESWSIATLEKNDHYATSGYKLTQPDKTYEMPEILVEISGIAVLNDSAIFCVQDEAGVVFKYDLRKEELAKMYRFTDVGDFEDITINGGKLNILRSDGMVFSIDYENYSGVPESRILPVNSMNIEGLFYDKINNKYLIACKDQLINQESSLRHILSFGKNKSSQPEVAFTIDLNEINTAFKKNYSGINAKLITFNPSSISVHPITGDVYVLSASNRLLAIYGNNLLKSLYPLAEELFYKPEGISFDKNGDMYISSEGNKKGYVSGRIHYFKWKN